MTKSTFDAEALNSLVDVQIDGIDTSDYPDFCDAYICAASYPNGTPLTDEELDDIQDNHSDWVYECVIAQLY